MQLNLDQKIKGYRKNWMCFTIDLFSLWVYGCVRQNKDYKLSLDKIEYVFKSC